MVYIASPYTHSDSRTVQERFNLVSIATAIIASKTDEVPYSPIMHWHPIDAALGGEYMTHARYLEMDLHMIDLSSAVWVYMIPGFDTSKGVQIEVDYAVRHEKPVFYFTVENGRIVTCQSQKEL